MLFSHFLKAQDTAKRVEQLMFETPRGTSIYQKSIGHSHNDYRQRIPLLSAYYAGMQSIEADVFLKEGVLYVAHDRSEIDTALTLWNTYLQPLIRLYQKNGGFPFSNHQQKLQLVIDIKEQYQEVIKTLINLIQPYQDIFSNGDKGYIQLVLSGDMPEPKKFDQYPVYIQFDGRPEITYTSEQLQRVAMISQDIKVYTHWNGKGVPTSKDLQVLKKVVEQAHQKGKRFRFWATHDSSNTWLVLEKIGVDILNTDRPNELREYFDTKSQTIYQHPKGQGSYKPKKYIFEAPKAKNVILLIGDGMGLAQIKAAYSANFGELSITQMPFVGLSTTEALNSDNTDSAAGGTAIASGSKTNNRYIGMDTAMKVNSLVDILKKRDKHTTVITTGDVTDATPAVFYAHVRDREEQDSIALQLPVSSLDILVGSGRVHFEKNAIASDLITTLRQSKYHLQYYMQDFLKDNSKKQIVLLDDTETRPIQNDGRAWLTLALQHSLEIAKKDFFIMLEGAQIDYGGHANDIKYTIKELLDFDKAVAEALAFAEKDGQTLVIVTADHETGGLSLLDADQKNGYVQGHFSTNDHTNIMVPVFAYGPGASKFSGTYQNTDIFKKIVETVE